MSIQQNMQNIPIYEGKPLTDEQKRLIVLLDEMRKGQIGFVEEAGKRIIELSTGLLGVLFAVTAFGDKFPPPYLKANPLVKWMMTAVLVALVAALLSGVLSVQPRKYDDYESNLSKMREEFGKIAAYKMLWMKAATWLFFVGTLLLAALIGIIVFSA